MQMFGRIVMDASGDKFEEAIDQVKTLRGVTADTDLNANDLKELVEEFRRIVKEETGREFPQDPREQLRLAIRAVFDSWNGDRARLYRKQEKIPDDLGTAVNVVAMVFGNLGDDSGTGVAFTRDCRTGENVLNGDFLTNAQGEDVVSGARTPESIAKMKRGALAKVYRELERIAEK